ncbi:hypothetical protein EDD86DRAFT_210700 [Gorgonomyces haynaldii]|nr:hypothetical protein EDD86DRAFT_210700 [Gorgonomyces haynaldii]
MLFVAAQSFNSEQLIKTLCASQTRSTYCEIYSDCSKSALSVCSASLPLLNQMCLTDFSTASECAQVKSYCGASNCAGDALLSAIPPAKNTSDLIYLTCQEMPMMTDCKTCPPPSATSPVSNCALLSTYSKLCLDMPGMSQCKPFNAFCAVAKTSSFCATTTGSTGSTPTSAPTKSDAFRLAPVSLLMLLL